VLLNCIAIAVRFKKKGPRFVFCFEKVVTMLMKDLFVSTCAVTANMRPKRTRCSMEARRAIGRVRDLIVDWIMERAWKPPLTRRGGDGAGGR
jgi:hypothetical protein